MIAANSNIAAAVVALLVKKGGKLRLRKSELAEMGELMLTIEANPNNPDVLHFGTMPKADYEAIQAASAILAATEAPEKGSDAK